MYQGSCLCGQVRFDIDGTNHTEAVPYGQQNYDHDRVTAVAFVATSKANWEDICGDLPQYVDYEPER